MKTDGSSTDVTNGLWIVMDGRARLDPADATVFEADHGSRDYIPRKWARMEWKGRDAVLCFAKRNADGTVGPAEYVEDVG